MAAIATSTELTPTPRVAVTLSAWTDGAVTITRVHLDGARVTVRGVPDASGGVTFVYDYEMPLGEPFTYEAYSGASLISGASVTVASTDMYVSVPGVPTMVMRVDAEAVPEMSVSRPTAVLDGPFRSVPPVEYGELQSPVFGLSLRTNSAAERLAFEQILRQSGVLLVRMPLTEYPACYVEVSGFSRSPLVGYRRQGASTTTEADQRKYTLTCVTVGSPTGGSYGDPTSTYQALVDSTKTYQQLLDWKGVGATIYLDMLKGGF